MFIIITVNTGQLSRSFFLSARSNDLTAFAIRRYAHAFTTFAYTTNEIPLMYLFDYTLWDNSGCVFMLNLLVWMADALAVRSLVQESPVTPDHAGVDLPLLPNLERQPARHSLSFRSATG
jgi:hypothetical protein